MANKDLHRGWGTLPSGLFSWTCPACHKGSPVIEWKAVLVLANGHELDGRECPSCQHKCSTLADSDLMALPSQTEKTIKPALKAKRKKSGAKA